MALTINKYLDGKMKKSCGQIWDSTESSLVIPTGLPSVEVYLITNQTRNERALRFNVSGGNITVTSYVPGDILNFEAWSGI